MGAIVTEIKGSVGGTTFRGSPSGTIMTNKIFGASKNRLLNNTALFKLSEIISSWSYLSDAIRNEWNAQALLFEFPNKFGDLKNLSGRQLFIKLNTQAYFVGGNPPNVSTLNSTVSTSDYNDPGLSNIPSATIRLYDNLYDTHISIQAELIPNFAVAPSFTRRKIIYSELLQGQKLIDFTAEAIANFPSAGVGDIFNIYVMFTNLSGFRSGTTSKVAQVRHH